MTCGGCGKRIAAGVAMMPGADGQEWYLGACCWEDRKVKAEPTGAAEPSAVASPIGTPTVPERSAAKEDVGDFSRPKRTARRVGSRS